VAALDLIVAPALPPDLLLGLEQHFLQAVVSRSTPPALIIYASPGRYISIGSYHRYNGPSERDGISVFRRLTGGRVVGGGEGWLGLSLILPTRTSLLNEERDLKPDQIMNRYSRGVLTGLRGLGINCLYPGRDAITFERREIAMCTYEIDSSGAMLFETSLAVNRGMEEVVHDLEHLDPEGVLPCQMYGPDSATKVVRELDRDIEFRELAVAIGLGYEQLFGQANGRDFTAAEFAAGEHQRRAIVTSGWLNQIATRNPSAKTNRIAAQLGSIEAQIVFRPDERIETAMLTGDFIANSRAVAELQNELRGKPLDLPSVSRAVTKTFAQKDNFILGAGDLSNLIRLIADAN
jgi:lipoate-protein ligase A